MAFLSSLFLMMQSQPNWKWRTALASSAFHFFDRLTVTNFIMSASKKATVDGVEYDAIKTRLEMEANMESCSSPFSASKMITY